MSGVFDPGLQPERTALAWRRTGLALFAGSLVATRILPELLGAWAALVGLAGVVASAALLYAIHRRYHRHHRQLMAEGDRSPVAGGRLIAATAAFALAAATVSLWVTLAVALR
jgi:putative membrane protein